MLLCVSRQGHGSLVALLKVATGLSRSGVTRRGVTWHSCSSLDGFFMVRGGGTFEVSHIVSEKGAGSGITAVSK